MGCPAGSNHNRLLSHPAGERNRARTSHGTLYLLYRPEHNPVLLCRYHGLSIPFLLDAQGPKYRVDLPDSQDPLPIDPRQRHLVSRIALWLRQSVSYRLPDFHSRQIMQTSSGYVPQFDYLPQALSAVQIFGCPRGHARSRNLHTAPPWNEQEDGSSSRKESVGFLTVGDLPALD